MEKNPTKITCSVNSPISEYVSKQGDMIILPGAEGELGILPNHMSLVAELKSGQITIYDAGQIIEHIDIKGGIAYVKETGVEVFLS
ncbi:MAG: hypothetical protein SFT91_04245 [Rickettsiaceae bacterium]|nr:hypothetical protein [Rickettsiaceae bacterium]